MKDCETLPARFYEMPLWMEIALSFPTRKKGSGIYQPFPGDALAEQLHAPMPNGNQRVLGVEI